MQLCISSVLRKYEIFYHREFESALIKIERVDCLWNCSSSHFDIRRCGDNMFFLHPEMKGMIATVKAFIHTCKKLACKNFATSFLLFSATRQVNTRSCKRFSTRQGRVEVFLHSRDELFYRQPVGDLLETMVRFPVPSLQMTNMYHMLPD